MKLFRKKIQKSAPKEKLVGLLGTVIVNACGDCGRKVQPHHAQQLRYDGERRVFWRCCPRDCMA